MLVSTAGVTQAVFPEGGLSRDGRLRPVKLGLIGYIAAAWEPGGHDIVFVPVGLNYDRVLEDRSLIAEIDGPPPRLSTLAKTRRTLAFLWRNLRLRLSGRWHRFGYACVSFGTPVSLAAHFAEAGLADPARAGEAARAAAIEALGTRLMGAIAAVVPALPVSLVATALGAGPPVDALGLKARVGALIDRLAARGAHVHVPRADRDYAVDAGLRMFEQRHIVTIDGDGLIRIRPGEERLVAYYANAIAHLV